MSELLLDEEGFGMSCAVEGDESLTSDLEFWIFKKIEEFDDASAHDIIKGAASVRGV